MKDCKAAGEVVAAESGSGLDGAWTNPSAAVNNDAKGAPTIAGRAGLSTTSHGNLENVIAAFAEYTSSADSNACANRISCQSPCILLSVASRSKSSARVSQRQPK